MRDVYGQQNVQNALYLVESTDRVIREELPCEWRVLLRQPFPETRFYELGSDVGQRLGSIWALKTKYHFQILSMFLRICFQIPWVLAGNVRHGRCYKLLGCKAAPGLKSTKKQHQQLGDS